MGIKRAGDPCPSCKRPYTKDMELESRKNHSDAIRLAHIQARLEGTLLGRPRIADYDKIYELRDNGVSVAKVALRLNVSRGAIQHAMKARNK